MSDITPDNADLLLDALGEQLAARDERFELVVIGGSALLALGLVARTTKDVDVVALRSGDEGGPGKHESDLRALAPTAAELVAAARWSWSHDPSPAYAQELRGALKLLGVTDVDL